MYSSNCIAHEHCKGPANKWDIYTLFQYRLPWQKHATKKHIKTCCICQKLLTVFMKAVWLAWLHLCTWKKALKPKLFYMTPSTKAGYSCWIKTNDPKQGSNQNQQGIQGVCWSQMRSSVLLAPQVCFYNSVFPLQFKSSVVLGERSILSLLHW